MKKICIIALVGLALGLCLGVVLQFVLSGAEATIVNPGEDGGFNGENENERNDRVNENSARVLNSSYGCIGPRTRSDLRDILWGSTSGYERHSRPGEIAWATAHKNNISSSTKPDPDTVKVQTTIQGVKQIDTKFGTMRMFAYLRSEWNDPRLRYSTISNKTSNGEGGYHPGCMPDLVRQGFDIQELRSNLWAPDLFIMNEIESQTLAESFWVYPNGKIIMARNMDMKVLCDFNIDDFPLDITKCSLKVGTWLEDANDVILEKNRGLGDIPPLQLKIDIYPNKEYEISVAEDVDEDVPKDGKDAYGATQPESKVVFGLELRRIPQYYWMFTLVPPILFVFIGWLSFWVARGAVPARVTMSMICFLTNMNFMNATLRTLPKETVFLSKILIASVFFTFYSVVEYVLCNVLFRIQARLSVAHEKAAIGIRKRREHNSEFDPDEDIITTKKDLLEFGFSHKLDLLLTRDNGSMRMKDEFIDIFSRYVYPVAFGFTLFVIWLQSGIHNYRNT